MGQGKSTMNETALTKTGTDKSGTKELGSKEIGKELGTTSSRSTQLSTASAKPVEVNAEPIDPREEARALERKANAIRREVDLLIAEADRRRHRMLGRQFQVHPLVTVGAALLLGAAAVGGVVVFARRYQRRNSLSGRLTELGRAVVRVARRPEKIGRQDPNLMAKLAAAFGTAVVGALGKRSVSGLMPEKH
jgi:hypothetical protein